MDAAMIEKIKQNIAARKAREAAEQVEREANGGKTLAEIKREREARQIAALREAERARTDRAFSMLLRHLCDGLEETPKVNEEAVRIGDLKAAAAERYREQFGVNV